MKIFSRLQCIFFSSFLFGFVTDVYAHNILQFSDHFYLPFNTFYINTLAKHNIYAKVRLKIHNFLQTQCKWELILSWLVILFYVLKKNLAKTWNVKMSQILGGTFSAIIFLCPSRNIILCGFFVHGIELHSTGPPSWRWCRNSICTDHCNALYTLGGTSQTDIGAQNFWW